MAQDKLRTPLNSLNEVGIAGFLRPSEIPKVSSRSRREMDLLQVLSFFSQHFFFALCPTRVAINVRVCVSTRVYLSYHTSRLHRRD